MFRGRFEICKIRDVLESGKKSDRKVVYILNPSYRFSFIG